ncbi:uracil-xanthine permease family protein [Salinifilum ghardaiensis]
MALWTVHGNGRRPLRDAVVATEERLSWPVTIGFGIQHAVVMFGSTMLVPLLTGFPASTALLFSGLGTLLFLVLTRYRVPAYLGASLAFVVPLNAAVEHGRASPAALLGGIVTVGLAVVAVGVAVKALGVRLLEAALPPVITGTVVLMFGASLAPRAVSAFDGRAAPGVVTVGTIVLVTACSRGVLRRSGVLLGVAAGWAHGALTGAVPAERAARLDAAPWVGLPEFVAPEIHLTVMPYLLPLVIVLVAEHVAHIKAVAVSSDRDLDPHIGNALIGGGAATALSAAGGGAALSNSGPNVGLMAATRVYSTAACFAAAVVAVLVSFCPKVSALLNTIPPGVVGGVLLALGGLLALVGVRVLAESGADLADPVNLLVLGTALLAAVGDLTLSLGGLRIPGLVWGSVGIVVLYPLLRRIADLRG